MRRGSTLLALAACAFAALGGSAFAQPASSAAALPTLQGRTAQSAAVDLRALRGKVVMLFFWSTDCPVCLDKLPELRRNLDGWRGKDFVIVAVSQDRSRRDLADYEQVLDRVAPPNAQMQIVWRRDAAHRDSFGELPLRTPTVVVLDRSGAVARTLQGRLPAQMWDDVAELVLN